MESLSCCSFRFSDPCLLNPSDNDSKLSGLNTPECRNGNGNGNNSNSASAASALNVNGNGSGTGTGGGDMEQQNKFFAALMEQINILHETNSKICRNLHETKGMYVEGGKGRVIPCKLKAIVFLPGVASYLSLRKKESVNFVKVFSQNLSYVSFSLWYYCSCCCYCCLSFMYFLLRVFLVCLFCLFVVYFPFVFTYFAYYLFHNLHT